jgi:sterol desaturase/sphingolipid hydroxylase (fatty acid hydroxylase superfamily)
MSNDYFGGRKKISFFDSVVSLIGHLLGSAILFLSFYAIGWIISFVVHWLNLIHKVPSDIAIFTAKIELWIVYADAVLCFFVILAGAYRFIRDLGDMR